MKLNLAFAVIAVFAAPAALAQSEPTSPTRSFEGENVEATKSASYDAETQTVTRDASITNKNTGETATRTQQRQRTENGSTYTGVVTGPDGQTVGASGERYRDGEGNSGASQSVQKNGETVGTRNRATTRSSSGVSHSINRSGRGGRRRGH